MNRETHLDDTNLSVRARNVLAALGCSNVGDVCALDFEEIYHARNCGTKTIEEISSFIKQHFMGNQPVSPRSTVQWLKDNDLDLSQVRDFVKANDAAILELQISARAYNALRMNHISKLSEIIFSEVQSLEALDYIDHEIAEEIAACSRAYLREHKEQLLSSCKTDTIKTVDGDPIPNRELLDVKRFLCEDEYKAEIITQLALDVVNIDVLNLSARASNALKRNGIHTVAEVIRHYPNGFDQFRNLGAKTIEEICDIIERYVLKTASSEHSFPDTPLRHESEQMNYPVDVHQLTTMQILHCDEYADKAKAFLKSNNIALNQLNLSARAINALARSRIFSLLDIVQLGIEKLYAVKNMGVKTVDEVVAIANRKLEELRPHLVAYCLGETAYLIDDEQVQTLILRQFKQASFTGLHFKEFRERISENISDQQIKDNVGKLLEKGSLEYVDFCCYRVYPSVFDVLCDSELKEELYNPEILLRKYRGETLEYIGNDFGLTRERVRQICVKAAKKLRVVFLARTGMECFDEDYYAYLYQNYDTNEDIWTRYLHIDKQTYTYLKNEYNKGQNAIADALSDPRVELNLKYRINDYLMKDKLMIDGMLLDRSRGALEDYVLKKYFSESETDYETFCSRYNQFLEENDLASDEKLVYSKENMRTRKNKLAESMLCLWKFGERIRYYDTKGQDYDELLEVLDLDGFENTELSTLKLFEEYPATMKKYDIRDQYELHNLLKKTVPKGSYHSITFSPQPMIGFGEYDRSDIVFKAIKDNSPISTGDLMKLLRNEYGYEPGAITNYLSSFANYSHNGIFNICDIKPIPEERKQPLMAVLTEDFYYIEEIKKIYADLFCSADQQEISPYSLKELGFQVLNTYAIQNHTSAYHYFRELLTKNDVYSMAPLRKRYGTIQMYSQAVGDLRHGYEIFVFGDDQVVTMNRLSRLKIQKSDIISFCDEVDAFATVNEYFTIASLRNRGFSAALFDLGFDDLFYAGILAMDSRFSYQRIFGGVVLIKDSNAELFSKNTLMQSLLRKFDSVDVDEFMDAFYEEYGIRIPDKYEVTGAVRGTELYYDPIMGRIYRNKEYYYSELDD